VYFNYAYVNQKHLINAEYSVLNHSNFTILPLFFDIQYTLNFIVRTKHLFIFTIYTIYSKVLTSTNLFCYKFQFLKKRQKKFSILRAPCNHKNSKEQLGINVYQGKITCVLNSSSYKFYHNYVLLFFAQKKQTSFASIQYTLKKK